jgi:hypothetical protein
VEEKFRWLAGHVLDGDRVDALVDVVWHFEAVSDVRKLTRLLV